jgi:prephenate dehydrogenase
MSRVFWYLSLVTCPGLARQTRLRKHPQIYTQAIVNNPRFNVDCLKKMRKNLDRDRRFMENVNRMQILETYKVKSIS